MKSLTFFLISSFLISIIFSCSNGQSDIEFTVKSMAKTIPKIIKEIEKMPGCTTSDLKPICSQGYRYWASEIDATYIKGVSNDYENVDNFLAVLFEDLPLDKSESKDLRELMTLTISADALAVDLMGLDVVYNKNVANAANKGCYFTILYEKSCKYPNEYDFLFTMSKSWFKLGKEIFLLEEASGDFFSGTTKQKAVAKEPDLSREQYMALLKLLQIGTFSNADFLVKSLKGI